MTSDYARISSRIKAVIIDSIVVILLMLAVAKIILFFPEVSTDFRVVAFVFIFVIYDPLFTSVFGGTIGHMISGIRVRNEKDESKRVIFPAALFRFILKVAMGWVSLLTVSGHPKKRAIHDLLAGSVVVYDIQS